MFSRPNCYLPRRCPSITTPPPQPYLPFLYPRWYHDRNHEHTPSNPNRERKFMGKVHRVYGEQKRKPLGPDEVALQKKRRHAYLVWSTLDDLIELRNMPKDIDRPEYQEVVYVSELVLMLLVGDEKENMWIMTGKNHCRVHVLGRRHHDERGYRKVVISGSPQGVKLCSASLLGMHANVRHDYPPFVPNWKLRVDKQLPVPLIRSIWTDGPTNLTDRSKHTSVLEAQRPQKWSVRKFADFVAYLTKLPPPHSAHRLLYSAGQNHNDIVRDMLYDLFNDPSKKRFFSTRAINLLIRFYHRHSYLPHLRALFPVFEDLMTVRTSNLLLEGASLRGKLMVFQHTIRVMKHLKIQPSGLEWAHYLRLVSSTRIKYRVLARLRREGVLEDYAILQGVMKVVAPDLVVDHLGSGQTLPAFMDLMTQRFGHHWLDVNVIAAMFKAIAHKQDVQAVKDLANYCKEHNLLLNYHCLNMALICFLEDFSHEGIEFYLWFRRQLQLMRDRETMRLLFSIAWKNRAYNTCRVIWRYACIEGTVSWGMQSLVFKSLTKNTRREDLAESDDSWWAKVGKVVTGVDLSSERFASKFQNLKERLPLESRDNPLLYLCEYKPSGLERDMQLELVKLIFGDDMAALGAYGPVHPFDEMIAHAHTIDMTWGETEKTKKTAKQLMEDAIHVPFEEGGEWFDDYVTFDQASAEENDEDDEE